MAQPRTAKITCPACKRKITAREHTPGSGIFVCPECEKGFSGWPGLPEPESWGVWCYRSGSSIFGGAEAWLKDENDQPMVFGSEAEAEAEIEAMGSVRNCFYEPRRYCRDD